MDGNITEVDEEINVDEMVEDTAERNGSFDPALPPAKQKTTQAIRACGDALRAKKSGNYANDWFGDLLPAGECNGSIHFDVNEKFEGLYYGDHKLSALFGYRGRTTTAEGEEAQVLLFRDHRGHDKELIVPFGVIAQGGAPMAMYLSSKSFYVPTHKGAREALQKLLNVLTGPYVRTVSRPGWVGDTLVYAHPLRTIGDTEQHPVVTDWSSAVNLKTGIKGTPEGSRELLKFCGGNSRLLFASSVSLAAALLPFAPNVMPGMYHFFGQSSIGKSTMGLAAGSFWGGSDDLLGFSNSWNGTLNYHLKNAVAHSSMVYVLDEMRAGTNVTQAAYAFGSGHDRGRLTKSADQVKGSRISVFTLSNGEVSLDEAEKLTGGKQVAFNGAEVRAISINADTGSGFGAFENLHDSVTGAELSERIQSLARQNYGHVGLAFVEALIPHIKSVGRSVFEQRVSNAIEEFVASLKLPPDADDAVKRAAKTFGLVAFAGGLASDLHVFPLKRAGVIAGVCTCFNDWLAGRGGARSKTSVTALVALRDFVNSQEHCFQVIGETNKPTNLVGYKDTKNGTYCLLPHAWQKVMAAAPRAKLADELLGLDLLVRPLSSEGSRTFQTLKYIDKSNKVRVYEVDGLIRELTDDGTLEPDIDRSKRNVVDLQTRRAVGVLRGEVA